MPEPENEELDRIADECGAAGSKVALRNFGLACWRAGRAAEPHCPTCICGKRAPVQGDGGHPKDRKHGPGSIAWAEHLQAWSAYAARYGEGQSAERMAERGGFGYGELQELLGREPETWEPRAGV